MKPRIANEQPINRAGTGYGLWFWIIVILAVIFLLAILARAQWY